MLTNYEKLRIKRQMAQYKKNNEKVIVCNIRNEYISVLIIETKNKIIA